MYKEFLITGSSGFIGTNFINQLKKNQKKFFSVDIIKNRYLNSENFLKLDLTNATKVNKFFKKKKFDYVIHFVAFPGIMDCDLNPEKALYDNLITTLNILKNEKKFKKIVLISSYATLDEASFSFYAGCKKIIEQFSNTVMGKNKVVILRLPNIYGKFSEHKKSVVHQICKSIVFKKKFLLHGSGKQQRNYIYVDDLCDIILKVCYLKNKKKIINIGNKKNYSILKIMSIFKNILNQEVLHRNINHPLDNKFTKTKKIVNKPDYLIKDKSFKKNLEKTLIWYKENAAKES